VRSGITAPPSSMICRASPKSMMTCGSAAAASVAPSCRLRISASCHAAQGAEQLPGRSSQAAQ
jgi:hypothetical protein